jgi:hypothetical protein
LTNPNPSPPAKHCLEDAGAVQNGLKQGINMYSHDKSENMVAGIVTIILLEVVAVALVIVVYFKRTVS